MTEGNWFKREDGRSWNVKYADSGGFPPMCHEMIEWLLVPKWERNPVSLNEWAKLNNVPEGTAKAWRYDPRVKAELGRRAAELNIDHARIQSVIDAVYREAERGDIKAASLYLQYISAFVPTKRVITEDSIEEISDEELRELVGDGTP